MEKNRTRALTMGLIGDGDGLERNALIAGKVRVELRLMKFGKL